MVITATSKFHVRIIPLECLQIKCYYDGPRFPEQMLRYVKLLQEHPDDYAGFLSVTPSDTHPGMYALLDGHHRFCASIMAGRKDALCVVIEEVANE